MRPSILYPRSSILYPLSSILYPLSSILYPLSSILYPLSSILKFSILGFDLIPRAAAFFSHRIGMLILTSYMLT